MTGARPSWRSLPAGRELNAEVAKRVYNRTGREIRNLVNRGLLPPYSTSLVEAIRLLRDFDFAERAGTSPVVTPVMVEQFNKYLAEGRAKALRAGSLFGVATWCSRPLNIARAALYATENPRRHRQG